MSKQPFARIPFVGHTPILKLIRSKQRDVRAQPICRAMYIEAEGGLGKTHLLQHLPNFVGEAYDNEREAIVRVIDLSDTETRSGSVLEHMIIEGLKQSGVGAYEKDEETYRLPDEEVEQAFADYHQLREEYERQRGALTASETKTFQGRLRDAFVQGYNHLASPELTLILRFDTVETLYSEPVPNEFLARDFPTSATIVIEWFDAILPRLHHTLFIACGRPPGKRNTAGWFEMLEKERLDEHGQPYTLMDTEKQVLPPLDIEDIQAYLATYGKQVTDSAELDSYKKRTDGRPLLLTCLAQPALSAPPDDIETREEFEQFLLDELLNPITHGSTNRMSLQQLCLCALAYARRGLTRAQLQRLLHELPWAWDEGKDANLEPALDELEQFVLVKVRPETGLIYLHDEIYVMMNKGGYGEMLGLRDDVLAFALREAEQQAEHAKDRTAQLKAITDRVYYTLAQDPEKGYRAYTIATINLFLVNQADHMAIVRDEFWHWLSTQVNEERLKTSALEYAEVVRDDAVWLLKYHMVRGEYEQTVKVGEGIQEYFKNDLEIDDYFKVDFYTTFANAQTLYKDVAQEDTLALFQQAIAVLEKPPEHINQQFLRDRKDFFLGETYSLYGYLLRTISRFQEAEDAYKRSLDAYTAYKQTSNSDFDTVETVAQTVFNLIYVLNQQGKMHLARRFANELLKPEFFQCLSADRQALAYNMNANLQTNSGNLQRALVFAEKAWKIVTDGDKVVKQRTRGLIANRMGIIKQHLMSEADTADHSVSGYFQEATEIFTAEATMLREVLLDRARYERTLARLCDQTDASGHDHYQNALNYFNQVIQAIEVETETPTIQLADALEGSAVVYRLWGQITQAEEMLAKAEDILRNVANPPTSAQIIAGRIAFGRGLIALERQQWQEAFNFLITGLARCYLFSETNPSVARLRDYLEETVFPELPDEAITQMSSMPIDKSVHFRETQELPYLQPEELAWRTAWNRAMHDFRNLLDVMTQIHPIL